MNKNIKKKMLVTCAFPYANGKLHLGHLLENIQADIWVRFHRMINNTVFFICSDDAHGTATMLTAQKMNILPEDLINIIQEKHKKTFLKFSIVHDYYSSTHSLENKNFCYKIFKKMLKKKLIKVKEIFQLYDIQKKMFLSDRFVKGLCPICKISNQYGDHCEKCGSIYDATDLINPISIFSNTCPVIKKSIHLFFKLSFFSKFLKNWVATSINQSAILNKTKEWFNVGLKDWDISRDSPYFGFLIPKFKNKFFYVWLDAPIGYMSCFKELCNLKKELDFNEFWKDSKTVDLFHFIGKDIVYFHTLFWPAILKSCNYRQPTKIFVHGYLTINSQKLSKSKNIIVSPDDWLSFFDSDSLRYYFASKLSDKVNDIEINLEDFRYKINSDIVNNLVNIASRSATFLNKKFSNILSSSLIEKKFYFLLVNSAKDIELAYRNRQFHLVIKKVIFLSDLLNRYITKKKPWILIKNPKFLDLVHQICSFCINGFRILITFLKPIVPVLSKKTEKFLKITLSWDNFSMPLLNHKINNFQDLYTRISKEDILKFKNKINL